MYKNKITTNHQCSEYHHAAYAHAVIAGPSVCIMVYGLHHHDIITNHNEVLTAHSVTDVVEECKLLLKNDVP